jgi:hypothetical protein
LTDPCAQVDFLSRPTILRKVLEYINGSAFDDLPMPEIPEEQDKLIQRRRKYVYASAEWSGHDAGCQAAARLHRDPLVQLALDHAAALRAGRRLSKYVNKGSSSPALIPRTVPFWNQVLDKSPQDTIEDTMQLTFWAKTNSNFLAEKPAEAGRSRILVRGLTLEKDARLCQIPAQHSAAHGPAH